MELRKQGAGRKMGSALWAGNNVEISCLVKCNRKLLRGWNRVTYPLGFGTVSKAFFTCSSWSEVQSGKVGRFRVLVPAYQVRSLKCLQNDHKELEE